MDDFDDITCEEYYQEYDEYYSEYDIEYDSVIGCYCLHYVGEVICLGANTYGEAREEARELIDSGELLQG